MEPQSPETTEPSPPQAPEGTVTVLFTDVEGSTNLRTREGDDVATGVMRTHERLARAEIVRHGGHEAGFMGDGFMVVFPSARTALECAIAMQRCFEEHNRAGAEIPIRVRMGLNTGEVRREGLQFYGSAINAAARIASKARGGQILASQVVRDLAAHFREMSFVDRGSHLLKGFQDRFRLYEVTWLEEACEAVEAARAAAEPGSRAGVFEETYARPSPGPLIGRNAEKVAVGRALQGALEGQIQVLALEGEAGIGKTRLLEAAGSEAGERGFQVVMVSGDEELRGPFFLLRTLLASTSVERLSDAAYARDRLDAARDAVWGRSTDSTGLPPNEQLLRIYDLTTLALRALASTQPLAMLFDDIQWADEDSLKLIRYLVRTSGRTPFFVMLAHRPDTGAAVTAATTLVADLQRMGHASRLRLGRLTREETLKLLEQVLSTPVGTECAATLHQRGEGVPFFIVEFARAFKDAGLFHTVDGMLEVSSAARSTVPPSIEILIERRLAQLPEDTRGALADAAVVGRRFRAGDLAQVRAAVSPDGGASPADPGAAHPTAPTLQGSAAIADLVAPAVAFSLLSELPEGAAHDYAFTHDEIRSALLSVLPRPRRRAVHAALVELLAEQGETPQNLPLLAHHALEAGDSERGIPYAIAAARTALDALAPEAALRVVTAAQSHSSTPEQRATLLELRDDALNALGRGQERLATLAELQALSQALENRSLGVDVMLRRASASRQLQEYEQAADLARDVRELASVQGDARGELAACVELGQALMRAALGEVFSPSTTEIDLEGAAEAFERAAVLAEAAGDEATLAALKRELGVVELGRVRRVLLQRLALDPRAIEEPDFDPLGVPEIREGFERARTLVDEAIAAYERLGDSRGTMVSLIAMAYANIIEDTTSGHAGRLEQIRRLRRNLRRLTSESERAESEAHMLYSIHVYARSHGPPDLALARGVETFEAARALGDRELSFLAAGGVALAHAELEQIDQAQAWLDRAAALALEGNEALPARQMETWRGTAFGLAGDAEGMRTHLERALELSQGCSPGGRCDLLATLALQAARLGTDAGRDDLVSLAEARAAEGLELARALPPSDAPFTAQVLAAQGQISLVRGDAEGARRTGLAAAEELLRTRTYFPFAYPELWLVIARALHGSEEPTARRFQRVVAMDLLEIARQIRDDGIRARWLGTRVIRELVERVGADTDSLADEEGVTTELSLREVTLLKGVMSGETNRELAQSLGATDDRAFEQELQALFKKVGAHGHRQAAAAAVRGGIA